MKRTKRIIVAVVLLVSLLLPAVRLAGGPSLAQLEWAPATAWACEDPSATGGCGG